MPKWESITAEYILDADTPEEPTATPTTGPCEKLIAAREATPASVDMNTTANVVQELTKDLSPGMVSQDFVGYFVVDRDLKILASSNTEQMGLTIPDYEPFLTRTIEGTTTVSAPFPSAVLMKDDAGKLRTGTPTMFVCSPIRDNGFQVIGALALQIRPEREFTRILQLGRIGESGCLGVRLIRRGK